MESLNFAQEYLMTLSLPNMLEMIIGNGFSVNTVDRIGRTPLICASKENLVEVVELLLQKNALVNTQDFHGSSALSIAAEYGFYDIVKMLLDSNKIQNINVPDNDGDTSLICASWRNQVTVIKLLIEHGANPLQKNNTEKNCIHYSLENGWSLSKIQEIYNYTIPLKSIDFVDKKTCYICREDFVEDVNYSQCLQCRNIFCIDCLTPWFQIKRGYEKKCPYCVNTWIQPLFYIQKTKKLVIIPT